jgi:hypothetical protein
MYNLIMARNLSKIVYMGIAPLSLSIYAVTNEHQFINAKLETRAAVLVLLKALDQNDGLLLFRRA